MARRTKEREYREIEIEVTAIGFEGVSVGRVDDVVHFVKGALPGERVRAVVRRTHRRYVEAETLEVLVPSTQRITPPCPHFGTCGGCSWQHLVYEHQLQWKSQHVADAFQRIGGFPNVTSNADGILLPAIGAQSAYAYRNKMEFSFSASAWLTDDEIRTGAEFDRTFALGLHVPGRYDKVRNIDHCALQSGVANRLLAKVHALPHLREAGAYDHRAHRGFLRHLVLRHSYTTDAVLATLITTTPETDAQRAVVNHWLQLHRELPEGSTIIHAINDSHSPVAIGTIQVQKGPGFIEESTHGVTYRISPFSFFQTNTVQMSHLVEQALQGAQVSSDDVVWDLYCGTGTLTLPAARKARLAVGAELAQSSIDDAVANAQRNGITNATFHVVDLHAKRALETLLALPHPNVVIIDPPRSGLHPQVVDHLLEVAPQRIAYVSCNPATQARDCALLAEKFSVDWVRAVDMFPQTYHVESVAALTVRSE